MEKSRSPGKTSSHSNCDEAHALEQLKSLAESALIKPLREALGEEAALHIVGGTVRDILCKSAGFDIDLATRLPPEETIQKLEAKNIRVVETGIKHGTLTAIVDHNNIEITTFRQPQERNKSGYSDTIEEDLSGRDFTINAIAYSINETCLIDPFHGIEDLDNRLLRAVGSAEERISEDPHRMLRMIRFGPAAGREVDQALLKATRKNASLLQEVSPERIKDELLRILLSPQPSSGLQAMLDSGILEFVLPEALPSVGFAQNRYHIEDVFQHTLTVVDRCPEDASLRLAGLFHDLGKPATLSIDEKGERHFYKHEIESARICKSAMRRLRFSNEMVKKVSTIVWAHMRPIECGPAGIRRLKRDLGDYFHDWRAFKVADKPPVMDEKEFQSLLRNFDRMVQAEEERQKNAEKKLLIDGNDLMRIGFKSGKPLGDVLRILEERVIEDPDLNKKSVLIDMAKELRELKQNEAL